MLGALGREAAEDNTRDTVGRMGDLRRHRSDGDASRAVRRKTIHPCRDRRESDRAHAPLGCERERRAITGSEQVFLALVAAAPDRADRVNDVFRFEAIAPGNLGGAGVTAAERLTLSEKFRPRGAMDSAVDAAATEQCSICRIDDGVDIERRYVRNADLKLRRPNLGAK